MFVAMRKCGATKCRYGSQATDLRWSCNVRYSPESDHKSVHAYSITSSAVASSVARIFGHDDIHIKSDQIACGGGDLFSFSALASALIMTRCV
jgi:hypothetical protein